MTKNLKKQSIMRSKPRNNYKKNRNYGIGANTSANASFSRIFYEKTRKNLYKALHEKQVTDRKTFSKNVKPFFSDKDVNSKIMLLELTQF